MDYEDYSVPTDVQSESVRYEQPNTQALLEYSRLNEDLDELSLTLSGKTRNIDTGKVMPDPYGKQLLNSLGVKAIVLQLKPYFSRSATFNDIKPEFINKKLKTTLDNIKRQLLSAINMQRWDLHQSDIEVVWETITSYTAFNLSRSKMGGERNAITSSVQSKEITSQNAGNKKGKSLFGIKLN